MARLSNTVLKTLAPHVAVPMYDRSNITTGIVHIGVGGFHRAHEAVYLDDLFHNHGITDWGICGVGLLPQDRRMQEALRPQDCLYTVVARSAEDNQARVIGSITEYLLAPDNPAAVLAKMADPGTRIVSLTITEGGYTVIAPDGAEPMGVFGYLVEALRRRQQQGTAPFTVLSCDNVQGNGEMARKVLLAYAEKRDPALARWMGEHVAFPNCMVDRITPQTTPADKAMVYAEFGIEDAWPVVTEPFRQWVIEDTFSSGRPPLEEVGAQMTADVHPYERMKIRLLNASHSAMGYLGYLAGFRYIHTVMADSQFRQYIQRLMDEEVTPLLAPVPGIDLTDYKRTLIERFANPAINDQVLRICLDGSSKMPKFLLPSLQEGRARGGPTRLLTLATAGWLRFLAGEDEQGNPIPLEDPMAETLTARAREGGRDARPLLDLTDIFGDLGHSPAFVQALNTDLQHLYEHGARVTLAKALVEGA